MRHTLRALSISALGLLALSASAQSPSTTGARATAFRRAATLTRGINASGWFGGWGDYAPERTSKWITADDLKLMRSLGFTYVRIGVDPVYFGYGRPDDPGKQALWKRLDDAIDLTLKSGLIVDLCVFPRDDYKQQLANDHGATQFLFLWEALAHHFASRDPDHILFELMNESEVQDPYRWIGIQSSVVTAIRRIDTTHTILASGAHYDSLDDLLVTQPLADENVIYTFHFYEPYQFTHQGATWGSPEWLYYKNIPFPATVDQLDANLKSIPSDIARYQLFLYASGNWNADLVRSASPSPPTGAASTTSPSSATNSAPIATPPHPTPAPATSKPSAPPSKPITSAGPCGTGAATSVSLRPDTTDGHPTVDPAIAKALNLTTP